MGQIRVDVRLIRRALLERINQCEQIRLRELAELLECHHNTVWLHIHALESSGYIQIERGKGRAASRYYLLQPAYEELGCIRTANT